MSIQIGSSTLSTYRNFKEQLVLTTASSNLPILSLSSSHASNNVLIRTGTYVVGQSNSDFIFGYSNSGTSITNAYTPAIQFINQTKTIKFYHNIDASNINSTVGKLDVMSDINVPKILTSNIVIVFNSNPSLPNQLQEAEFIVKTPQSNLFVINGYNNTSYFLGNIGIGTTLPNARLHTSNLLVDTNAKIPTLSIDTLSFNNYEGITMQIDAGDIRFGRNAVFDNNVTIDGNLQVQSFEIVNLNTNEGNFKGLITVDNAINIQNFSNQNPSLNITRHYSEADDFYGSNQYSNLQPIVAIEYKYTSNEIQQSQRVLTIDPIGRIGIGTTVPYRLIDIFTYSNAEMGSNKGVFGIQGDKKEEVFCIDCNAFIGIGTTTPRYYLDMMMHSNLFESSETPAFLSIQKNNTPVLWLSSNGNFGIHTSNTEDHIALKVNGVLETEYLSVHRIIPVEGPDVHFTHCNIDAVNSLNASNAFIPLLGSCNIYADLITANNYNLLAFNSYRSTKELEFELDDLIFSGKMFVLSQYYPTYYEKIGATNINGGLEGTSDPTLSNKPTDKLNVAQSGKIHIIAEGNYETVGNDNEYQKINNGIVITTSNVFSNLEDNTITPFLHVMGHGPSITGSGKRVGGYSIGVVKPNIAIGDSMTRITLEENPLASKSMIDTCTMSIKPYSTASRRIGWRYNYSDDILQTSKLYITNTAISENISLGTTYSDILLNPNKKYAIYANGSIRADGESRTLFDAVQTGTNVTFSIGQSIDSATTNALEVNGNTKITDNTLIQRVLTVNSNIYAKSVISQTSDARLKENLKIIDHPLEKINQLTGYTFDRIDIHTRDAGLIAQDVLAVLPEIVSQTDDGYYSLAYGNMAGLFVESIKTLMNRIESLEHQVKELKEQCQHHSQQRS
jgi:hypothetical protein